MPAAALSDRLKTLLDGPVFIVLGTVQPDGSPQLSPVWVKRDGDHLLVSTTVDRRKKKNLDRDPPGERRGRGPRVAVRVRGVPRHGGDDDGGRAGTHRRAVAQVHREEVRGVQPASAQDAERVVVRIVPRKVVGSL
ncbi:pyridoxamine 5'-phosphate oxidase family protein [Streptomyces sp. NPDC001156]